MSNITHYHVVSADHSDTLIARVRDFIDAGWQPQGGVGVEFVPLGQFRNKKTTLYQAMVRYADV